MAANLAKLEVPALLKLRDEVEARLASMKDTLTEQLAALGIGTPAKRGRKPDGGKPAHALEVLRWGLVPRWWSKPLKELRLTTATSWALNNFCPSRIHIAPDQPREGAHVAE